MCHRESRDDPSGRGAETASCPALETLKTENTILYIVLLAASLRFTTHNTDSKVVDRNGVFK